MMWNFCEYWEIKERSDSHLIQINERSFLLLKMIRMGRRSEYIGRYHQAKS